MSSSNDALLDGISIKVESAYSNTIGGLTGWEVPPKKKRKRTKKIVDPVVEPVLGPLDGDGGSSGIPSEDVSVSGGSSGIGTGSGEILDDNESIIGTTTDGQKKKRKRKMMQTPRIETFEEREARLMHRRVIIPLPRIPKRDIRRCYSTMFANVYNSANWSYMCKYIQYFFHPTDFTFTFQSPLPLTSSQLIKQVFAKAPLGGLGSSSLHATNVVSSLVLNESIPLSMISGFFAQAFPDLVRLLGASAAAGGAAGSGMGQLFAGMTAMNGVLGVGSVGNGKSQNSIKSVPPASTPMVVAEEGAICESGNVDGSNAKSVDHEQLQEGEVDDSDMSDPHIASVNGTGSVTVPTSLPPLLLTFATSPSSAIDDSIFPLLLGPTATTNGNGNNSSTTTTHSSSSGSDKLTSGSSGKEASEHSGLSSLSSSTKTSHTSLTSSSSSTVFDVKDHTSGHYIDSSYGYFPPTTSPALSSMSLSDYYLSPSMQSSSSSTSSHLTYPSYACPPLHPYSHSRSSHHLQHVPSASMHVSTTSSSSLSQPVSSSSSSTSNNVSYSHHQYQYSNPYSQHQQPLYPVSNGQYPTAYPSYSDQQHQQQGSSSQYNGTQYPPLSHTLQSSTVSSTNTQSIPIPPPITIPPSAVKSATPSPSNSTTAPSTASTPTVASTTATSTTTSDPPVVATPPLPLPLQQCLIHGIDATAKFWYDRMHDAPDLLFTPGPSQIKVRSDGTAAVKFLYTLTGHRSVYLPGFDTTTSVSSQTATVDTKIDANLEGESEDSTSPPVAASTAGPGAAEEFLKCVTSYFCPFEDQLVPLNDDTHLIVPHDLVPISTSPDDAVHACPDPSPAVTRGEAIPSAKGVVVPFALGGVITFHLDDQSRIVKLDMRYDLLK